jgi:hypothetical protein
MLTIQEIRQHHPEKPVYAHFYTTYSNRTANFAEANQPIKASTWKVMLENAFRLCDGVVMSDKESSATWNEHSEYWTATKDFIHSHQKNIVYP